MTVVYRSLSTDVLYRTLLSTNANDHKIKPILLERLARSDVPSPVAQGSHDYDSPRPGDTELTGLVREAWRRGYRCQNLRESDQGVKYMRTQMRANWDEASLKHEPTKNFWSLFRNKYAEWEIAREDNA